MAEPISKTQNADYVPASSISNEIIDNLVKIIDFGFSGNQQMQPYRPTDVVKKSPKGYCLRSFPTLFVWISRIGDEIPNIGAHAQAGRRNTVHEYFTIEIVYVESRQEAEIEQTNTYFVADNMRYEILANSNINDIAHGPTIDGGTSFDQEVFEFMDGGTAQLCIANTFKMTLHVQVTRRKQTASRR